ncbi:MAG TPA: hypothetical protein VF304_10340, partial [Casimicrobiaceae bacterium]
DRVKESAFIANLFALAAGYVARLDAESGDRQAAAAAVAANRRYSDLAKRDLPPGSFGHEIYGEFLSRYGFPTTGFGYGVYAPLYAEGDFDGVRKEARASAQRLEDIAARTAGEKDVRDRALEMAWRTAADASYALHDYASADAEIKRALELRKRLPPRNIGEERDSGIQAALAAMIAARSGRNDDARKLVDPVLELQRRLYARADNEDLTQRIEFAQALYASALAGSARKSAELKQAASLIDALPPQMRNLISVRRLGSEIAEAKAS